MKKQALAGACLTMPHRMNVTDLLSVVDGRWECRLTHTASSRMEKQAPWAADTHLTMPLCMIGADVLNVCGHTCRPAG